MPTYILTGANRGLGLQFVKQLSAESGNTIIAAVRSLNGELDELRSLASDKDIHILECDTGNLASIEAFGKKLTETIGDKQVDYLLNNAGINGNPDQLSLGMDAEAVHKHIDINVIGPAKTVEAVLPHLKKGSVILNMTSGLGSLGKKLPKCTGKLSSPFKFASEFQVFLPQSFCSSMFHVHA